MTALPCGRLRLWSRHSRRLSQRTRHPCRWYCLHVRWASKQRLYSSHQTRKSLSGKSLSLCSYDHRRSLQGRSWGNPTEPVLPSGIAAGRLCPELSAVALIWELAIPLCTVATPRPWASAVTSPCTPLASATSVVDTEPYIAPVVPKLPTSPDVPSPPVLSLRGSKGDGI